jgi:hypothetical protein
MRSKTMTIRANIEERIRQMVQEIAGEGPGGGEISQQVKQRAIAAIMGGAADWVAYMNLFAKTPAELARLIPSDGTQDDPEKREARAYLVANAICTPGTATGLADNVFDRLDTPPVESESHVNAIS